MSSDPTLKRSSVTINYTASDGYSMQVNYSNIGRMGSKPPPEMPLLEAIEELARLCALFGFGDAAAAGVAEAMGRVEAWRAKVIARQQAISDAKESK
jgi:hypothetical protein